MAVTQGDIKTHRVMGPGGFIVETTSLAFTSTTATVELKTRLSKVFWMGKVRVGDASASHGDLTIDETLVGGAVNTAAGAFTVDRHLSDAAGTLADETFLVELHGY